MNPTAMKPATVNRLGKPVPKRRAGYYVLDDHRVYPSITTILQVIAKPQLIYWSAKVTAEALMEDPTLDLDEAIATGKRKKESAGDVGTTIHSWAEAYKRGAPLTAESLPESIRGYGEGFLAWVKADQPKIFHNELEVYNDRHQIAGKTDMIAMIRGKMAVVDIKTSKGIYPEYGLQLSAYRECINSMGGDIPGVEDLWILHLKADGNYEFRRMDEPFEVFLAAKRLWQWTREVKA